MVAADLGDEASLRAARDELPRIDAVVHAASSSRGGPDAYRRVFIDGLAGLSAVFQPSRILFTGSTSVYAQTDGSLVDESSPAEGASETSRLLIEAERVALAANGTVLRLAGLYGPGRCVVLRKFFDGSAVLEDGGHRILNQIHRADAASAAVHLLGLGQAAGQIYNVADDVPASQRETYNALADQFHRPLPPEGAKPEGRKRGWTSKRVSNAKLRATGWSPVFPSFLHAVSRDPELVASIHPDA
jgi:nucleoside-diphosphate-sugar epimerase